MPSEAYRDQPAGHTPVTLRHQRTPQMSRTEANCSGSFNGHQCSVHLNTGRSRAEGLPARMGYENICVHHPHLLGSAAPIPSPHQGLCTRFQGFYNRTLLTGASTADVYSRALLEV